MIHYTDFKTYRKYFVSLSVDILFLFFYALIIFISPDKNKNRIYIHRFDIKTQNN